MTVLAGAVLIAPHVVWLFQKDFPPLRWVATRWTSADLFDWLRSLSEYSFGTLGYSAVAVLTCIVLVQPPPAAWRDVLFLCDAGRRMALLIFWLPLLVPVAVAAITRTNLLSLWNTESLALLAVVLLSSPLITVTRTVAARITGFAIVVSVAALIASPIVAATKLSAGVENDASYVPAAVVAIDREWKTATDRPLKILAGPFGLANSIAFTLKDRPSTFADFSPYVSPWVDAQALLRKGLAVICPSRDTACMRNVDALRKKRPEARRVEVELTPRWLGFAGTHDRFVIAIIPPRKGP